MRVRPRGGDFRGITQTPVLGCMFDLGPHFVDLGNGNEYEPFPGFRGGLRILPSPPLRIEPVFVRDLRRHGFGVKEGAFCKSPDLAADMMRRNPTGYGYGRGAFNERLSSE